MFNLTEDKTRSVDKGQYFVELTKNRGLEISNCDRLGYWCDKGHLKHFYDALKKVFEEEHPKETINLLPDSIKITYFSNGQLGLVFNGKQVFTFDNESETYVVHPLEWLDKLKKCKLVEVKFKEIKAGDFYIELGLNNLNPNNYRLRLTGKENAKLSLTKSIEVINDDLPNKNQNVLRIEIVK